MDSLNPRGLPDSMETQTLKGNIVQNLAIILTVFITNSPVCLDVLPRSEGIKCTCMWKTVWDAAAPLFWQGIGSERWLDQALKHGPLKITQDRSTQSMIANAGTSHMAQPKRWESGFLERSWLKFLCEPPS